MKTFMMYRREDISDTHDENQVNPADEPQFQGIEFDNGKVAICWLTNMSSISVWDSMDDMLAVHGHPEYGSELEWIATEKPSPLITLSELVEVVQKGQEFVAARQPPEVCPTCYGDDRSTRPYWSPNYGRSTPMSETQMPCPNPWHNELDKP